jgi:hypothetical protein
MVKLYGAQSVSMMPARGAMDQRQDVVRMALFKSLWLQIFSNPQPGSRPA